MLILNGKEKAKTQFCGKKIHQIRLNTEAWGGRLGTGSDAMQAVFWSRRSPRFSFLTK